MLTIGDLLIPGGPLAKAELLAGSETLCNGVTWAVSLRPYSPAIPSLKGGEIALVGTDVLARYDPPVTLADVVRQLTAHGASGLAVRGAVAAEAISEAERLGLPLVRLPSDIPLHDIEQAIIRECALYQARQEVLAGDEQGAWIGRLLAGKIMTSIEAQGPARREGYKLGASYAVALLMPNETDVEGKRDFDRIAGVYAERYRKREIGVIISPFEAGLVLLVPTGCETELNLLVQEQNTACGLGQERPLLEVPISLREARIALLSSTMLHDGTMVRYCDLGAERMLLLLYLHSKSDLETFVETTLGPLLEHDSRTATPLLPTMSSFVGHGGRLRETAADIYVHRNTLAYRLDRAAEILGMDLRDADAWLAVELALRALPLVR